MKNRCHGLFRFPTAAYETACFQWKVEKFTFMCRRSPPAKNRALQETKGAGRTGAGPNPNALCMCSVQYSVFFFFPNTATCLIIWLSNQCVLESALLSATPSSDWSVGALGLSPAEPDRPEQTGVRLLTLLRVRGTLHCWWETDTWERHLDLCNILVWANSSHQGLCQILYQINVETPKGLWDMSSYSKTKAKSQKVTKELE